MRNKEMCKLCKYKGGSAADHFRVFCDYAGKKDETALKKGKNDKPYDSRGKDPENCLLFEPDDGVSHDPLRKLWHKEAVK